MATLIQHPDRPNRWRSWFTNWKRHTRSTRAERNKKSRWKPIRNKNHIWLGHQRSTRKIKYNFMQHCKFCQSRRCQFRQTISKILSVVSSIYDPLGFVAPFIFLAKTILQDMCRSKPRWDDQIPEDALQDGRLGWKCYQSLKKSSSTVASNQQILVISCHVNFTIFPTPLSKDMELSYLIVNQKGDVHCSFLIGKSRLAPLKAVTIPRMELSAAVVATRLDKMMRQELNLAIDESTFWTDSTCVLRYIENESRRFQTFVANRVSKIHDASKPSQWRYVSTNLNPADDTSRGLTATEILENERWLMGPAFLRKSIEHWPSQDLSNSEIQENDPELKKAVTPLVMAANKNDIQNTMCKRFEKFSSWKGLKKAIACRGVAKPL